tara:strand:- start:137 stop:421 length:285 start_codon:yes stop_codon:yes gene_type:complete
VVILKENIVAIPAPKKTPKTLPKKKKFSGITEETKKSIEDALSEAMTDEKKNPTSKYNTLKGRNNTLKRKKRHSPEEFAMGGDVRYDPNRGKTY